MVKKKKKIKLTALLLTVFLGIILLVTLWLYKPGLSGTKLKILSLLPLPIATVDKRPVFAGTYLEIKHLLSDQKGLSDVQIYSALLLNEQYWALQSKLNTKPIYENKQNTNLLEKYQATKKGLALYYNSNQSLNSKNYELANNLVLRLKQGESFESLAKTYSQDLYSKSFGGLTGENDENKFLPEVEDKIFKVPANEPEIISSSLGLHIILKSPESNTVRQIYLQNSGFEEWLKTSSAEMKIKTFIKP